PRREVVVVRVDKSAIGRAGVAGIEEIGRSCRENSRLLARIPTHNLVVRIFLRRVVFVAKPIVETQVLPHLPCVLCEKVKLVAANAIDRAGKLVVIVGEAADKIGERTSRICIVRAVVERPVIVKIEVEITLRPAEVSTEL